MIIDDLPLSVRRPRPISAHFVAELDTGYYVFGEQTNNVYVPQQTPKNVSRNNYLEIADISQNAALYVKSMSLAASCDNILLSNAIDDDYQSGGLTVSFYTDISKMQLTQHPISAYDFIKDLEINSALTTLAMNTSRDRTNKKEKMVCRLNGRIKQIREFQELGYERIAVNITLVAYDILHKDWINLQWGQSKDFIDRLLLNGGRDYQFQKGV